MLVAFAQAYGWRHAFFSRWCAGSAHGRFACVAGPRANGPAWRTLGGTLSRLQSSVPWLLKETYSYAPFCRVLLVSYLVVCWAFMPLYLTRVRGYDATTMGWLMGSLGIAATVASTAIPAVSDRIGRRGVVIAMPLIAVVLPLGAMYFTGPGWGLAAIFVTGWLVTGVFPLFMATVPSESVDARYIASALGICMGTGELIGGVLAPFAAGYGADVFGLQAPLWIMFVLALGAGLGGARSA